MAGSGFSKTALFRLSNATSDAGAGLEVTVVTKTADFTLGTATDIVLADASAGAITISLPAAANASGRSNEDHLHQAAHHYHRGRKRYFE